MQLSTRACIHRRGTHNIIIIINPARPAVAWRRQIRIREAGFKTKGAGLNCCKREER